jgi:hypothetical protein
MCAQYGYGVWERFAHLASSSLRTKKIGLFEAVRETPGKGLALGSLLSSDRPCKQKCEEEASQIHGMPNSHEILKQVRSRPCISFFLSLPISIVYKERDHLTSFSIMRLPGMEMVAKPPTCRSTLHDTRASQLPYSPKYILSTIFLEVPAFPPVQTFEGLHGNPRM